VINNLRAGHIGRGTYRVRANITDTSKSTLLDTVMVAANYHVGEDI